MFTGGCILRALRELTYYEVKFAWPLLLPTALLAACLMAARSHLAMEPDRDLGERETQGCRWRVQRLI